MAADEKIPEVTLVFEDDQEQRPRFDQRPHGERGDDVSGEGRPGRGPLRDIEEGAALPVPGVPVAVLGVTLGVMALAGVVTTSLGAGAATLPSGVAVAATFGSAAVPTVLAGVASAVFGPLGMVLVVLAAMALLGSRARTAAHRFPLLVVMGTAWIATGLVATVTTGAQPFLASAVAASAAAAVAATLLVRRRLRLPVAAAGVLIGLAVAACLVYVGTVSVIGAVASLVVGLTGALLGAAVWNRRWAPVVDRGMRSTGGWGRMR